MAGSSGGERSLEDRVALVTGGAVRLGRAFVLGLLERGARVAFTYNSSADAARELEDDATRRFGAGRVLGTRCNVTREPDVDAAFAALDARFGRIDLLVNSAAIFERTTFEEITLASWQRHLDVNLSGSFLCAKRAGDRMLAQGDGVIVNVACAGGLRPWPGHVAYSVSKAGVVMLTQVLATALAPKVRVNAIVPGPLLMPEGYGEDERRRSVERTLLRREGSPQDAVRAMLFCWDSDYTTGALIPVDGGRHVR